MDRRQVIAIAAAGGLAGPGAVRAAVAALPSTGAARPQWIAFPGQLAAHNFTRRMARAVERCAYIGYPGNFRQPVAQTLFRVAGTADSAVPMRWVGPAARVHMTARGFGSSITARSGVLPKGASGLACRIDFADRLPCLYLDAGPFSSGPAWEASLDGETWLPVECLGDDPAVFPDTPRTEIVPLPVTRIVAPAGARPAAAYRVAPGDDVILDFTETELGALRFAASGSGSLSVQVGESIAEVRDPNPKWFEQVALPPIALAATPQAVVLPERALRYVRLSTGGEAQVTAVRFDAARWTGPARGRFLCDDGGMNAIWDVAVATLRSNMHDFYLDGIRRDGLVWHDGPLCLPAYERVVFDATSARQTLVAQTMPPRPTTADSGIIDSPMYDVIGFAREWLARGDIGYSRLFRDRIVGMMTYLEGLQDSRGFIDARDIRPYGFFPDWSADAATGPDPHGAPAYGQMLLAGAFAAAARLATGWGDAALAARWSKAHAELRRAVRQAFYVPADRLFCNGFDAKGALDRRYSSFAQCFAIAFGIADSGDYPALIAFLDDYRRRPARFSLSQVIELEAYAIAGRADRALARLRLGWLPIVRAGYRRFFEDIDATKPPDEQLAMYDRPYGSSLCHAWAGAAPVMALSRGVLGIEALEPGFARCSIAPQPSGLAWFEGAVPTPHGPIEVSWRKGRGVATIPAGVRAVANGRERVGPATWRLG